MDKKYQIFISSTYEDLKEERKRVQDAILSMYHFPVGMELFGAADESQWEIITETIDSSDYYVLIIAQRYGSLITEGKDKGISYTEREYRYAKKKGIPILTFVIDDGVKVSLLAVEQDSDKRAKLEAFKKEAMKNRTVVRWENCDDLAQKVTASLHKEFNRHNRPGWIRGDVINIEESLQAVADLNKRVRELEEENRTLKAQVVVRKPELLIRMQCEGTWKVNSCRVDYPEKVLDDYRELTMQDVPALCQRMVTQKQLGDYNESLPTKEEVKRYADLMWFYERRKSGNVPFDFSVVNRGNCKANDIYITLEFPVFCKHFLEKVADFFGQCCTSVLDKVADASIPVYG